MEHTALEALIKEYFNNGNDETMDDSSSYESDNEGFLQLHNKTTSYCINYLSEQEVTLQVVENDPSNGSNGSNGI